MNTEPTLDINGTSYQLADVESDAWMRLQQSTHANGGFRTATLATLGAAGISLRTVVLRRADIPTKTLFFHSDSRAVKIAEIQENSQVSCLFYDEQSRIQLRITGQGFVHIQDTICDEHWAQLAIPSRKNYLSNYAPGTTLENPGDGLPMHLQGRVLPSAEESEAGKTHFAVLRVEALTLDWLWLSEQGHRRAQFSYEEDTMQWVAP